MSTHQVTSKHTNEKVLAMTMLSTTPKSAQNSTAQNDTARLSAAIDFVRHQNTSSLLGQLLPGLDGPELRALANCRPYATAGTFPTSTWASCALRSTVLR